MKETFNKKSLLDKSKRSLLDLSKKQIHNLLQDDEAMKAAIENIQKNIHRSTLCLVEGELTFFLFGADNAIVKANYFAKQVDNNPSLLNEKFRMTIEELKAYYLANHPELFAKVNSMMAQFLACASDPVELPNDKYLIALLNRAIEDRIFQES